MDRIALRLESAFLWSGRESAGRFDADRRMLYSFSSLAMDPYPDEFALLTALRTRDEAAPASRHGFFAIVTNKARARGQRESRTRSFSDHEAMLRDQPTVDPTRFNQPTARERPNLWAAGAVINCPPMFVAP